MNLLYIDSTSTCSDAVNTMYTNYNNSESGYFVMKLDPESLPSSQDSGICVTGAVDNSWYDDLENSSISSDSGYISSSLNLSTNSTLTSNNVDEYKSITLTQPQKPLKETSCFSKLEYLFDGPITTTVNVQKQTVAGPESSYPPTTFKTIVKIYNPGDPKFFSQEETHSTARPIKPIGHYARKPGDLQSKLVVNSAVHTAAGYAHIVPSPSPRTSSIFIGINNTKSISCSSNTTRKRKVQHTLRVDEYRHEDIKPTKELLVARRLLDEALITGNIVSQARYARVNSGLQLTSLKSTRRSVIESFKKKTETTVSLLPVQETETEFNVDVGFSKSSRVLYQGNRRLDNCKFTWKIGYNGPHRSFNKVAVRWKRRKNHKLGHTPLCDAENRNKKRRRLF